MSINTMDPVLEAARELPPNWLDRDGLPPNTPAILKHARAWRDTPKDVRRALVSRARDASALFILWTWEQEGDVRADVVRALKPHRVLLLPGCSGRSSARKRPIGRGAMFAAWRCKCSVAWHNANQGPS